MEDCIFCKIVAGAIPADKVLETDAVIAFMDINPAAPGHVLVVPKNHSTDLTQINDADLAAVAKMAKQVGILQKGRLGAAGFNLLSANGSAAQQTVFHTHVHVVPRYENDGRNLWFHGASKQAVSKEAFQKLKENR